MGSSCKKSIKLKLRVNLSAGGNQKGEGGSGWREGSIGIDVLPYKCIYVLQLPFALGSRVTLVSRAQRLPE